MQISTLNQKRILTKTKAEKNCLYFKSLKKLFKNMKLLKFTSVVSFMPSAKSAEGHNSFIGGRRRMNGQSTVEYAVLIACVMLALMTMYGYIKRGIQGKMRESADQIGSQYEPGNTVSDFTISSRSNITTISTMTIDELTDSTNATTITTTNYDEQQRVGTETVGAF